MLLARLNRLLSAISHYQKRQCSRQRLLMLDDHLLKDIGLSRADAEREGRKSFWKA